MAAAAILDNFEWPYINYPQWLTIYLYSTHRAVIFAIAQLSCSHFVRYQEKRNTTSWTVFLIPHAQRKTKYGSSFVLTARCTLMQSAVLR